MGRPRLKQVLTMLQISRALQRYKLRTFKKAVNISLTSLGADFKAFSSSFSFFLAPMTSSVR